MPCSYRAPLLALALVFSAGGAAVQGVDGSTDTGTTAPRLRLSRVELYEPVHTSPASLRGSIAGGTRLVVSGEGLLAPDGTFDESLVALVGGRPARLLHFLSSGSRLVLDTPALPPGAALCCHDITVRTQTHKASAGHLVSRASDMHMHARTPCEQCAGYAV